MNRKIETVLDPIGEPEKEGLHPSFFQCLPVFIIPFSLFLLFPLGARRIYIVIFFFFYLEYFFYSVVRLYISTVHYVAWPDRIEKRIGLFNRLSKSIPFDQITEISFTQNLYQKLFKIGDVYISTAGGKEFTVIWAGIKYPEQVSRVLFAMKKSGGT